jgi:hypothetical protein
MHPRMESLLFQKKAAAKILRIELDENDNIIDCIKQCLHEHKIDEATVVNVQGLVKQGVINYFQNGLFKSKEIRNQSFVKTHAVYREAGSDFYGDFHITFEEGNHRRTATLVKGIASQGLILEVEFISLQ